MTHSLPDYTTKYKMTTVFGNIDTGELAARTTSPCLFNREGNVYWFDDFEAANLFWDTATVGAGAAVALSTDSARRGEQSVKLTTGSDSTKYAGISKPLALPIQSTLGVEYHFTMHDDLSGLQMNFEIYNGTNLLRAGVLYDEQNSKIQYSNSAAVWTDIATSIDINTNDFLYYPWKLVVDYSTQYYKRLIFGNVEYDLSSYAINSVANATDPYLRVGATAIGTAGNNAYVYVDDVIVTQNEI